MTYLGCIFLLDVSILATIDDEKEEKIKVEEKVLEIHKHSWLSIT